jgi:S-DNA-T family DNA segregation ATPase FtsK/SpoIIIE
MSASDKKPRVRREIVAVCCLFLAVFIGCCLISYNSADSSFNTAYSSPMGRVHNWGGLVGAYLADGLFQLLGLTAFLVPLVLLALSVKMLFFKDSPIRYATALSMILLVLSLAVLLSLVVADSAIRLASFRYELNAGGLVGRQLANLSHPYLNTVGSMLVFSLAGLVALIILFNLSLHGMTSFLNSITGRVTHGSRLMKRMAGALGAMLGGAGAHFQPILEACGTLVRTWGKKPAIADEAEPPCEVLPPPPSEEADKEKRPRKRIVPVEEKPRARMTSPSDYQVPPFSLLDNVSQKATKAGKEALRENSKTLENKLADFGVVGKVVEINPGPVITRYELEPASGVRISKILNLADDLALALKAVGVRILAPVPGKAVVGIEIPNTIRETVYFKEIVGREEFAQSRSKLTLALGKDIAGKAIISDLAKMPHLLIAGSTGSGKSVLLNALICSILYKAVPSEVKFLMIDPKRLELSFYDDIPHLLYPVVTDPKKASLVLQWTVGEMERRYAMLADMGVRDIDGYNQKVEAEMQSAQGGRGKKAEGEAGDEWQKLPYIVVVIDELADLMMVSSREVETSITRLAQMARAAGIHLLVATQRPSVDVLTGTIKVNFPARISFQVSSKIDSRTILDTMGAERLLGMGDMLFLRPGTSKLERVHGCYLSEAEIRRITAFLRKQAEPVYDQSITELKQEDAAEAEDDYDECYDEAVALVAQERKASISMIQRRLRIGYNRAARIMDRMERERVVGPSDGVKPRDILIKRI